jgi:DNA mismatch endonuclease, patch repair protein
MGMSRSENMRRIRSSGTLLEIRVREAIGKLGYRGYRNNRKEILGKPDIVWTGRKVAVFVNGCFWHGHNCSEGIRKPKTNRRYWIPKLRRNRMRDKRNNAILQENGWRVLTIWECEIDETNRLTRKLRPFLLATRLRRTSLV